jgi:TonB family protein
MILLVLLALLASSASAEELRPVPWRDAPHLARDTRLAGTVVVEALVDTTGRVRATSIARSQPVLDDEAAARVARLTLVPLRSKAGVLVSSLQTIPVVFEAPPGNGPADTWAGGRCGDAAFAVDVDVRPDSSGRFTARWSAKGLKSQELTVSVLFPDGADVDTTHSWYPQAFQDGEGARLWPAWHREGRDVRKGADGSFTFALPEGPWWSAGRIAVIARFRDVFDGRSVVRQRAWRVDKDAMGPLLVGDPTATPCAAGPWMGGR